MTPSYAKGPDLGLLELTTHQLLDRTVARFGDREALVSRHQGIRLTWRELAAEVDQTARGLAGLGLEPGDRVGVWATNCAEWIYLHLGIARAGLVQELERQLLLLQRAEETNVNFRAFQVAGHIDVIDRDEAGLVNGNLPANRFADFALQEFAHAQEPVGGHGQECLIVES